MPDGQGEQGVAPGWYPDPSRRAPLRHWSGQAWTAWVCSGQTTWSDDGWSRRTLGRTDLEALQFVEEILLPEARAHGQLPAPAEQGFRALVAALTVEARADLPAPFVPPPAPGALQPRGAAWAPAVGGQFQAPYAPATRVPPPSAPVPTVRVAQAPRLGPRTDPRPVRGPSPLSAWFARARTSIGSELAVHGLAYLGVLMLFVGMFGLVAFAFSEVSPGLRPVAELCCAAVPFAAGLLLRRHGAEVVGRALEIVGGLILPLMVTASFVDGFPVPPELHGAGLVVTLTVVGVGTAAGYAAWTHRHPTSGLRFLVGPVLWFTAAMSTLGAGRPVPAGEGVAVPSVAQVAAMSAALALTLLAAHLRPGSVLAGPVLTAAVPGTVVIGLLALVTGIAEGWPVVPTALTGVLVLGAFELQRARVPARVLDVATPGWWALLTLALITGPAGAGGAAFSAGVFLALLELAGRRDRPAEALALPASGLVLSLLAVPSDPRWAAGAFGLAAAWAVARRTAPFRVPRAASCLDAAVVALPLAAVVSLSAAWNVAAGLLAATALAGAATVPATRAFLRRGDDDQFWRRWWSGALVVVAVGAQATLLDGAASDGSRWTVAGVLLALAGLCLVGPLPAWPRTGAVTGLLTWAWFLACAEAGAPDGARGALLAAAAVGLVVAGHRRPALAAAGHATAAIAVAGAGTGWGLVAAVAAACAGFAVTAALDDRGLSSLGARLTGPARSAPWTVVAVGTPVTAALALDTGGVVALGDPWATCVLAAVAVGYAVTARRGVHPRLVATMSWAGFVAALIAVVAAREPVPSVVALAALLGFVAVLPAARRTWAMRWAAWAGVAPLVGLLAWVGPAWFEAAGATTTAAVSLAVVGGVLLAGGAAADLRGRTWEPRWMPERAALVVPCALGAAELCAALALSFTAIDRITSGVVLAGVAVPVLAAGLLARVGPAVGVAIVVGWAATVRFAGAQLDERPWPAVLATVGLLVCGEILHRRVTDRSRWSRWDVPDLLGAVPVAATALLAASDGSDLVVTFVAIGLLTVAVALRLERVPVRSELAGAAGTLLILLGATQAGGGWSAFALVALSAAHSALALRSRGPRRPARQLASAGAAVAAWLATLAWLGWSAQTSVEVTVAGAGAIAGLVAFVARGWLDRTGRLDRAAVLIWGGTAIVVTATGAIVALSAPGPALAPSPWVVGGVVLVAAGLAGAAAPTGLAWLRDLAATSFLLSVLLAFAAGEPTPFTRVTILSTLAALLAAALLAGGPGLRSSCWAGAVTQLGGTSAATAVAVGLGTLPDGLALVPGLAAASVWLAAAGVAWRRVRWQLLSPAVACAGWMVFVTEAVGGGTQWYTVAIGVTLLGIVTLWRRDRRRLGDAPASPPIVALEIAAVAFLVGASLAQTVTTSVAHALVATLLGFAVAGWGLLTRVRRRFAMGALVVVVALTLLAVVPLVALLPAWGGAGVWILLAGVGLVAVLLATLLEKGRVAARSTRARIGGLTAGWE